MSPDSACTPGPCDLCGGFTFDLLHDRDRNCVVVNNYVCLTCGFVCIFPRPSTDAHRAQYEEGGFSESSRGMRTPSLTKLLECEQIAGRRLRMLESVLEDAGTSLYTPRGRSALDIGCGTGSFLHLLSGAEWKVQGLEPDAEYAAASSAHYEIPITPTPLEGFQPENAFDLAVNFQVIEHVPSPTAFVRQIRSLLKTDGLLFLDCPSLDCIPKNWERFFWEPHINSFSATTLRYLLEKEGYDVVSIGHIAEFLYAVARVGTYPECLVPDPNEGKRIDSLVKELKREDSRQREETKAREASPLYKLSPWAYRIREKWGTDPLGYPARVAQRLVSSSPPPPPEDSFGPKQVGVHAQKDGTPLRIAHVGLHQTGNAGDTVLFPAVRKLFQRELGPIEFSLIPLRDAVTDETIAHINQHDALLIGGGGLFIEDSNPNGASGWQWPCSLHHLDAIKIPIVFFAVGYNFFRGQSEPSPLFCENVAAFLERAAFVGLRNHGSIDAMKAVMPSTVHGKLTFQPCPTTCLSRFYGDPAQPVEAVGGAKPVLALNLALDRARNRFGGQPHEPLWRLGDALKTLTDDGWTIRYISHMGVDANALVWLRARGLRVEWVDITQAKPAEVLDAYRHVDAAAGMRGHAQMIPFGLNKPIFSLITHPKMRYFIEDIGHGEWGAEFSHGEGIPDLIAFLTSRSLDELRVQVNAAQDALWRVTEANTAAIRSMLRQT